MEMEILKGVRCFLFVQQKQQWVLLTHSDEQPEKK